MSRIISGFAFTLATVAASISHTATIPTVLIGNPGNPGDTAHVYIGAPPVGSVAQPFNIGKSEVTWGQYTEFLNAVAASDPYGLYYSNMGDASYGGIIRSGSPGSYSYAMKAPALGGAYSYENKPVVLVTNGNAMRFANWLHNGQPIGAQNATTTEDGAYTLNGAIAGNVLAIIPRNPGARWFLPNNNEWHKAAYYNPSTGTYYDYATGTNSAPNNNPPSSDTGDSVNYNHALPSSSLNFTDVGAYTLSGSPYGTFDQNGNAIEWTETKAGSPSNRIMRGGGWNNSLDSLHAYQDNWYSGMTDEQYGNVGFRLASSIPEPTTTCLAALAVIGVCCSARFRGPA
jgi:formylglycine-generating enzyme